MSSLETTQFQIECQPICHGFQPWKKFQPPRKVGKLQSQRLYGRTLQQKDTKLEATIFSVKASDKISFRLRHIERESVSLGKKSNQKDEGRNGLDNKQPAEAC